MMASFIDVWHCSVWCIHVGYVAIYIALH